MSHEEEKAFEDFKAFLMFLEDGINQYHSGKRAYFRMVALHSWILLCDTRKTKPLIIRMYPSFQLHQLKGIVANDKEEPPLLTMHRILGSNHLLFPIIMKGNGTGKVEANLLIDEHANQITLSKWLNQPFLSETITIQKFLESVRHKMGAHPDPDFDDLLTRTRSLWIGGFRSLEIATLALGEYVLRQIQSYMQ